jgi:hypothetical protein
MLDLADPDAVKRAVARILQAAGKEDASGAYGALTAELQLERVEPSRLGIVLAAVGDDHRAPLFAYLASRGIIAQDERFAAQWSFVWRWRKDDDGDATATLLDYARAIRPSLTQGMATGADDLTIFRAHVERLNWRGPSWTTSRAKALCFAIDKSVTWITSGTVSRDGVLADLKDSGEDELVIEPDVVQFVWTHTVEDERTRGQKSD